MSATDTGTTDTGTGTGGATAGVIGPVLIGGAAVELPRVINPGLRRAIEWGCTGDAQNPFWAKFHGYEKTYGFATAEHLNRFAVGLKSQEDAIERRDLEREGRSLLVAASSAAKAALLVRLHPGEEDADRDAMGALLDALSARAADAAARAVDGDAFAASIAAATVANAPDDGGGGLSRFLAALDAAGLDPEVAGLAGTRSAVVARLDALRAAHVEAATARARGLVASLGVGDVAAFGEVLSLSLRHPGHFGEELRSSLLLATTTATAGAEAALVAGLIEVLTTPAGLVGGSSPPSPKPSPRPSPSCGPHS